MNNEMLTTISINGLKNAEQAYSLIQNGIRAEKQRIELSSMKIRKILDEFELKYQKPSSELGISIFAEDLEGQDNEYVIWYGEYMFWKGIQESLQNIDAIEYEYS